MKLNRFLLSACAFPVFVALQAAAQTYQVTDLGALNGAPTFATAINDNGVVAGYSQPDATSARAWLWRNGTMTDAGSLGGAENRGLALGADDKLFGTSQDGAGVTRGFVWDGVNFTDLGSIAAGDAVFPQGVNASGAVVGSTNTGGGAFGFKLDGATMTALGTLPGATPPATSAANDISDAGQIVGVASWTVGGTRAFRSDATGALVPLGTLGANDSFACAINNAGDVVGDSVNASNQTRAFLFTDSGGMKDLGALSGGTESHAYGVNDAGEVAGSALTSAGALHATTWRPGTGLRDLNDAIAPNTGWVLEEARDINNGGDIVGVGTINGEQHAFLLELYPGTDTFPPLAIANPVVPPYNGAPSMSVTVTFWDNEKVVAATTHSVGTIRVSGPNGFDVPGTPNGWMNNDGQRMNTTFSVPAPGGTWDPADNGTYEIRVAVNAVSDIAGNFHPGGVIGTFTIGLQTAPTFNISGLPTSAALGSTVNLTVTASSSYPGAAGDVFTFAVDWDGDGADVQTVTGTTGTVIPHIYTSFGAHTVRARCTDPHGVVSGERTAAISVVNAGAPVISEALASPQTYLSSTSGVAATLKDGTIHLFGGYPLSNDNTPVVTWDYLTPGAAFVFRGDLDNGPITPEGAGVDGRGRIVIWGGRDAEGGGTNAARTYTLAGGVGGGVVSMPVTRTGGVAARDNLGRLYSLNGGTMNYRYDAGASGNGTWTLLASPPSAFVPATACFDGAGRIIVFAGNAVWAYDIADNSWSQLANAPFTAPGCATLGADGFIYVLSSTQVWVFDPQNNTLAQIGTATAAHTGSPALLGADGFIYYLGPGAYERIDTRPATTRAPRIATTPAGLAFAQGVAWNYQIVASGKPRPAYSLTRGPAGMSVNPTTGVVTWTPTAAQVGAPTAVFRATNSAGFVEQIATFNILAAPLDTTVPTTPGNVQVGNITTSSADITWSPSTDNIGVTGYRVYEKRTGGNRFHRTTYYAQLGAMTDTNWHTPALPQGTTKTYYIAAVDAAGNRSAYAAAAFTLLSVPGVAADTSGTFNGARAIVSEPWTGNVFTGYGNPAPTLSVVATPAGAVWHSTAANTGYFTWTAAAGQEGDAVFTVQATNASGSAQLTKHVTVHPAGTDLIPPNPVSGVVVDQVSWDSCRVTWSPTTDNYGVTGYRLIVAHREPRRRFHRGPYHDDIHSVELASDVTQVNVTGLLARTSYTATVVARDAAGLWSYAWSTSAKTFTTLMQPFEVKTVTQTANPDGSLTMTWPSYGYYWKFTVECTDSLSPANWQPVPPASQWPMYLTEFTIVPDPSVAQRFYRVVASPGALP